MEQLSHPPAERTSQPTAHHVRIQPERGWASLEIGIPWHYRDLLYILAMRDVKLRYKQTAPGIVRVILQLNGGATRIDSLYKLPRI